MELLQLKYFKTVAEIGKITAAAESLFISAPALSASISRLEKELGMPLFDRTHNSIRLNRQGTIFLRYVNQVFANLDGARAELRQSLMPQGPHVSVATLSSNMWIDLIAAFSQENPHFTLSCTSLRISQFAATGLVPQYGFLLGEDTPGAPAIFSELDSMPLFSDRVVVMTHPEHPLAARKSLRLPELLEENLFLPMQDYPLYERLIHMFETQCNLVPQGNSYSSLVCRHMVGEGLGVSFTTQYTSRMVSENLCHIPLEAPENLWTVRLYWRRNRAFSEDEKVFLSFVKAFYSRKTARHKV